MVKGKLLPVRGAQQFSKMDWAFVVAVDVRAATGGEAGAESALAQGVLAMP